MYDVILNHEGTKAQIFLCVRLFVVNIQSKKEILTSNEMF